MSGAPASEDGLVEQPALEWLRQAGWSYTHGLDLAPGERTSERDVVLRQTLTTAVAKLNPELPPEAVTRAVELALTTTAPDPIADHRAFHELLLSGVPVSWLTDDGERSGRARLVDWDEPAANTFTCVNQLTIVDGVHNRRPDILLFVNGLPLAQLELKIPDLTKDGPALAVNQVQHYAHTIPKLYRYVEVIGVSDLLRARVGTITTPAEHFAEWKSMDPAADHGRSELQILVGGVYAPAGLLDLIRNFVLFESDGAKTWKVMAKYHQVDAVNRAVEATAEAISDGTGRAGVVWHTQGSGKSYSMVFYATKLRRDRRFANPTLVCVTDTNDLDNQLSETFARQTHLAPVVRQAETIQGGPDSLHALLDVPADGIVFTTIQKFGWDTETAPMPVLSQRRNVVVIADEAHRSQYSTLAQNMLAALPNAARIGFTGTPIESADRSTRSAFGDYISVYRMAQAQADGATVPIYYESRQVPIDVDRAALDQVQALVDSEPDEAQTELSSEFARMDAVIGAPERLDRVTADLVEHFTERCQALPGKAMLVAYSRRAAAEYTLRLRERLGHDAVEAVFNAQATDERPISDFRKNKAELKECEERFKDPDSPLRIVVVKNMWLTGFDAPVLHTLYIDKPMRDHGLLQAIARVNRVFEGKPGGLVVDYIGIGDDLRASLTAYAKGDVEDVVVELAEAQRRLRENWEVLCDQLHGVPFRAPDDAGAGERATVFANALQQAAAPMVEDDERAQAFLDGQLAFSKWYKLVAPNEPAGELRYDHAFFTQLAALVRQATEPGPVEPSAEARRAVEQFFSEGLAGGEIIDVFALAGEARPELSVLTDEFLDGIQAKVGRPELQVALLRKLLRGEISARMAANRTMGRRFSDALDEVLQRYHQRQISAADVVKAMVELARELREQRRRHEQLGLTVEETAFYDVLAARGEGWVDDPRLKAIAGEIVVQVRQDLAVDWTERGNLEAKIRSRVKRLLRRHKLVLGTDAGGGLDVIAERVFEQAKALYERWPEVEGNEFGL